MGGVWERMVRSVKAAMRTLNDGQRLNDEILLSVLADSENLINSRPLTYTSLSSDVESITPNHFLLGSSAGAQTHMRFCPSITQALRHSYKRSQQLSYHLWDRWVKEYFPSLNKRPKWHDDQVQLKEGDLVFVIEGDRKEWTRAVVEEVHAGRDGRVRQAIVRTATGKQLKRPTVKLAVLDVEIKESEKERDIAQLK